MSDPRPPEPGAGRPEPRPPIFGDRYQLVRHIARGGMAQVYLARDLMLDRPVALKVLFPELSVDRNFVERFRREARAAANLTNPNIVSIYDWGQGDRTYYIVMEYVDGDTLSSRIRRGPLQAEDAARIASSVAAALSFAHRRSVIHRDVKPGNVLIDQSGQVKVTDFGIARAVGASENLTQAGSVMGTATYFSPEQAQGKAVDARSDVYSLGVVLYEMVVGRAPFHGDNPVAIAYKHVREEPEAPTSRNAAIPAAYEAIVLKAMAKDPAARYQSADELRADLDRFVAGRPVIAQGIVAPDATTVVGASGAGAAGAAAMAGAPDATRINRPVEPTTVAAGGAVPPGATTVSPAEGPGEGDDTPIRERDSHTVRWVSLLVVLLAILAVILFFIARGIGLFGSSASTRTITVPSVAGKPLKTAQATLKSDGFTKVTTKDVTSPRYKSGDVVGTTPGPGTHLLSTSPLTLDVSTGVGRVRVPDVAGKPERQAIAILRAKGFKPTTPSLQPSKTVNKGTVISTDPRAGVSEPHNKPVKVIVSSGLPLVHIPSVSGDTPNQASGALSVAGFKPVQASSPSPTVPSGQVIGTSPTGSATEGSKVTFYVSTGSGTVNVPNVVGFTKARAVAALHAQGLQANIATASVTKQYQQNRVQSTSPGAGAPVAKGSGVTLVIGVYAAPTTTTPPTTSPATTVPPTTATTTPATTTTIPRPTTTPSPTSPSTT